MAKNYFTWLEKKGIRELESYHATVTALVRNMCFLSVDGVSDVIRTNGNYAVGTELYISFDIKPGKFKPIVEWVSKYGDIVPSRMEYKSA